MATTAQNFFYSTNAKDFTAPSGNVIDKLLESAPGANATTICTHPNAAGTSDITLIPYTNTSTASDTRANNGWGINRLGADGMVSTASVKRVIQPGVWTFKLTLGLPTAGTGTGTLTGSFIAAVYRVDSSGNRTLLFTATSGTGGSTGLATFAGVLTATSSSQPEYELQANETIMVGFLSHVVQVAGLAGATVSGVATWTVGSANESVQVPSPGVRSRTLTSLSTSTTGVTPTPIKQVGINRAASTTGVTKVVKSVGKPLSVTTTGVATVIKSVGKPFSASTTGIATVIKQVGKPFAVSTTVLATMKKQVGKIFAANTTGVATMARVLSAFRTFSASTTGVASYTRSVIAARTFVATSTGVAKMYIQIADTILNRMTGGGTVIVKKVINYIFDD